MLDPPKLVLPSNVKWVVSNESWVHQLNVILKVFCPKVYQFFRVTWNVPKSFLLLSKICYLPPTGTKKNPSSYLVPSIVYCIIWHAIYIYHKRYQMSFWLISHRTLLEYDVFQICIDFCLHINSKLKFLCRWNSWWL